MVAGTTEIGEPMTFYSPDHPAPFTPGEIWSSGLTTLEEAKRLGFIGICDTTDYRLPTLREVDASESAPNAERLAITTQRFSRARRAGDEVEDLDRAAGEINSGSSPRKRGPILPDII